jgi:hypothetical protein
MWDLVLWIEWVRAGTDRHQRLPRKGLTKTEVWGVSL